MQLQSAVADLNLSPSLSGPDPTPAQEDAGIVQVAREITLTSDKITNLLNEVRGGHGRSWPSKLQTVLRTFKTIWNQNVTDELSKEVSSIQQSLHLHAIVSIKAKLDRHAMRLEDAMRALDNRTKELLPSFLANFGELSAKCDSILANQSRSEELATSRHLEVLYTIRASSPQPSIL
ncbi:hypothetical protein C8A01DRAFT_40833 [Parachaetomium inaequale]|uniref:Uncharacterized protein n=1 Tax=Parachaetomium inaequale TaxID=2588326 RepID=A0AAN6P6L8_9PEZI|nr:hypothetical protein C8A01DRAFT_40833 [Parachaetomium inaequale]